MRSDDRRGFLEAARRTASASTRRRCKRNIGDGTAELAALYVGVRARRRARVGIVRPHADRSGELTYRVAVDSLGAFNRWLPKSARRRVAVTPRPRRDRSRLRARKADSARRDRATRDGAVDQRPARPAPRGQRTEAGAGATRCSARRSSRERCAAICTTSTLRGRAGGSTSTSRGNYVRTIQERVRLAQRAHAKRVARRRRRRRQPERDGLRVRHAGAGGSPIAQPGGHVELGIIEDQHRQYGRDGRLRALCRRRRSCGSPT